jgi:O-methyltransferase
MRVASPDDAARLSAARAHLAAAREPRAAGAGPDAETLRAAYLDLLKLSLCDLAGAATTSVGAMADGSVLARELRGDELRLRAAGMDWPLHGLTMVGLGRLDDLQACVEAVVGDGIEGDVVEAGAWRGGAAILARATLDTLGDERTVWVADSFRGFPQGAAPDDGSLDLSAFDFLAVSVDEVRDSFARLGCERGVNFVPGFFAQSLPALAGERWAIVRLDADSYEATREALRRLYPGLAVGGYLIVDDYGSFEGCHRAVDEFREEHGIVEAIEAVDWTCVRWRRESGEPLTAEQAGGARPHDTARPPGAQRPHGAEPPAGAEPPVAAASRAPASLPTHVPTAREVELAAEVETLRARLAAAEAQIGLRAWLRRRLGREAPR